MSDSPLLRVSNLTVALHLEGGTSLPVRDVSFDVGASETVGLVGESGCGKSMTALSILRLIPKPPAEIVAGSVNLSDVDLLKLDSNGIRRVRGNRVAMIFQEPMTSLNPVYSCGEQIAEVLRLHSGLDRRRAWARAVEMLDRVQIPNAAERAREYPHQLSGGMRQRVMIAMAIACNPEVLIADEPTTALDVTIQREILALLDELQAQLGMGILHITHDLAVVSESAHRIVVMYAGQVVEEASVDQLFSAAAHPYSLGLLASRPELGARRSRLPVIEGRVPEPSQEVEGCRFRERCPFAVDRCTEEPPLLEVSNGHRARCWEFERVQREGEWPRVQ